MTPIASVRNTITSEGWWTHWIGPRKVLDTEKEVNSFFG
jgi:hypothetical protein